MFKISNLEMFHECFRDIPIFFVTDWIRSDSDDECIELKNNINESIVTHPGVFLHILKRKIKDSEKYVIKIFLENRTKYDTSKTQLEKIVFFNPRSVW